MITIPATAAMLVKKIQNVIFEVLNALKDLTKSCCWTTLDRPYF